MGCCQRGAGVQSPRAQRERERSELEPQRDGHPLQCQLRPLLVSRRTGVTRWQSLCDFDFDQAFQTFPSLLPHQLFKTRISRIHCVLQIGFLHRVFNINIRQGFGSADRDHGPGSRPAAFAQSSLETSHCSGRLDGVSSSLSLPSGCKYMPPIQMNLTRVETRVSRSLRCSAGKSNRHARAARAGKRGFVVALGTQQRVPSPVSGAAAR